MPSKTEGIETRKPDQISQIQCGATIHVKDGSFYMYRGLPTCSVTAKHDAWWKCMENCFAFVTNAAEDTTTINAWIHFSDDHTNAWVQTSLMRYFFPAVMRGHIQGPFGFVVHVPWKLALRYTDFLASLWYNKYHIARPGIPNAPSPNKRDVAALKSFLRDYQAADPHRAIITFCPSVKLSSSTCSNHSFGITSEKNYEMLSVASRKDFHPVRIFVNNVRQFFLQTLTRNLDPDDDPFPLDDGDKDTILSQINELLMDIVTRA